jgi:hypothetical protein
VLKPGDVQEILQLPKFHIHDSFHAHRLVPEIGQGYSLTIIMITAKLINKGGT